MSFASSRPALKIITKDQPYIKSPLSQEIDCFEGPLDMSTSDKDEEKTIDLITFGDQYTNFTSSHGLALPPYPPPPLIKWEEKVPHKKRHRRIDTATLIQLATKPFLTPHRIISLFAIVCAASYLARLLPLLVSPAWQDPLFDPHAIHRQASTFETIKVPIARIRPGTGTLRSSRSSQIEFDSKQEVNGYWRPLENHHGSRLQITVVDGIERKAHEAIEELERIEAGLREEEEESFGEFLEDVEENEDELALEEAAAEWMDDQILIDENEDVPISYEEEDGEDDSDKIIKVVPLPLQGSRRAPRPISDYLELKERLEKQKTLFQV